jgi:hypothetical protein
MKPSIKKFLEFNGKTIYFVAVDGQYWIALKPICEALNVNWNRQFQNLKEDKNLKAVFANQQMQAPDGQLRNYVSLPEFFIYGWIFQIQSDSEELAAYKWECYRVLYEHFHGTITGRKELLSEKARLQIEIDGCMNTLEPEIAMRIDKAKTRLNKINKQLQSLDAEALEEEKTLFDT